MNRVIVIPCFNEAARLDTGQLATLVGPTTSLLFVDDGSTDGTDARLADFARAQPGVQVLTLDHNVGKGESVRQGLVRAIENGAGIVGYLDADLAAPPREMLRLLDTVERDEQVRAAIGARVALLGKHIERRAARHYLGRVFATAASMTLHAPIYDTQCGAKAFRVDGALRDALAQPFSSRWVFDVELLARLLRPSRAGIVEVPLNEWRDVRGGALNARAMVGAGVDLLKLAARSRR